MARVIYKGKIYGEFTGFDSDQIFKMSNGTYWIQAKYKYWYHYKYRPDVEIIEENGRYTLSVEGKIIQVNPLRNIIESNIDGTFEGWKGNTEYKLVNGQKWKQAEYKYEYKYAYRPEVVICDVNGKYIMYVEGTQAVVKMI